MNAITSVKEAPHNTELEQQILGAVLVNNDRYHGLGFLRPDHFHDPVHADIWRNISGRIDKDHPASPVTVKTDFEAHEGLKELGGAGYLARMAASSISGFAVADYARELVKLAARRDMLAALRGTADSLEKGMPVEDAQSEIEMFLHEQEVQSETPRSMSLLAAHIKSVTQLNDRYQSGEVGLTTGLKELDELTGGLHPGELTLVAGSTSMGKAQPLNSLVLHSDGWKFMGSTKVGDKLASIDGRPSEVVGVYPQGKLPIFKVTFSDGRSARCCGEHLWQTYGPRGDQSRVFTTLEMREKLNLVSYQRRLSIPVPDVKGGTDEGVTISPWLLGVLLGDGYLCGATPKVSIGDAEILWRVQDEIGPDCKLSKDDKYDHRIIGVKRPVNRITEQLKSLGVYGKRAEEKFIPDQYLDGTRKTRLEILQGLMDTDGWVETFGAVRFSTCSAELAKDVQYLVRSLGGLCTIADKEPKYSYRGEDRTGQAHYVLNIRHEDAGQFFTLTKKKRRINRTKPVSLTVVSIEEDGFEEAQCIAVSHPTSLYITDEFVVTHNTAFGTWLAYVAAKQPVMVGFASLEMSEAALAMRLGSIDSGIPYQALRGNISEATLRAVADAAKKQEALPIHIYSDKVRDVPAILSESRRLQRQNQAREGFKGFGLLVIDYVQLVRGKGHNSLEVLSRVAMDLKQVAKMLDIPVVALAQVDRGLAKRDNPIPFLSDLRGSGDLEFAADNVIFCHRPEYYLERQLQVGVSDIEERADIEAALSQVKGRMDLIVAKQRMGQIGQCRVEVDMGINTFRDLPDVQSEIEF